MKGRDLGIGKIKTLRDDGEILEERMVTLMGRNKDAGKRKPSRPLKEEMEVNIVKRYMSHTF